MMQAIRTQIVLAVAVSLASAMCFAQSPGGTIYKASCQSCHGATGTPSAGMAKAMGIKPVSDPAIKSLTEDQIISTVKNGKGKMKPVAGLTDPQIKAVAAYFKTLK